MKTDWQQLYLSLELIPPSYGLRFPKPTKESCDEFESSAHFRLPKSYREFIRVFGPGTFGSYIGIRAPGCFRRFPDIEATGESARNFRADLGYFNSGIQKCELVGNEQTARGLLDDVERVRRCVYFADMCGTEIIGWDPNDIRDTAASEYGIYVLLPERRNLALLAPDFRTFVHDVCFGPGWGRLVSPSSPDEFPPKTFEPGSGGW